MNKKPLQIVMTPVRNEAWVLRAFLEATSLWADFIIIADQMSTDGSREIAKEYSKVILIDNNNPEFNEAERQSMLVAKAREVAAGRDTLLWGLDADEVLAANTFETEDWKRILNSKPGAVFWFKWAQLTYDRQHYYNPKDSFPWLFHDDGKEPHGNYVRNMHSMRIPYPLDEKDMYYVEDFRVLHFGTAPINRVRAKERFYVFVDWQLNHRNPYSLYSYINGNAYPAVLNKLPKEWIYTKEKDGFDIWCLVELDESHCWMDDYIYERLTNYPMKTVAKLPIWTPKFMKHYNITDPRPWYVRIVHKYLALSQPHKNNFFVRVINKLIMKKRTKS